MTFIMAGTIGLLIAAAVLLILQRDAVRVVVGLYVLWNATNLLLISAAAVRGPAAPMAEEGVGPMTDPLVQALVLTAIVITFGFTALLLTLVYWLSRHGDSIDLDDFREDRD